MDERDVKNSIHDCLREANGKKHLTVVGKIKSCTSNAFGTIFEVDSHPNVKFIIISAKNVTFSFDELLSFTVYPISFQRGDRDYSQSYVSAVLERKRANHDINPGFSILAAGVLGLGVGYLLFNNENETNSSKNQKKFQ